jgi:hypothetical protein
VTEVEPVIDFVRSLVAEVPDEDIDREAGRRR